MCLVSGLQLPDMKVKLLEYMQSKPNATVREMVCFLQNFEQSKKFVLGSVEDSSMVAEIHHEGVSSTISWTVPRRLCSFCGRNWHKSLQSCPARKSVCNNCNRKGHFAHKCRQWSTCQHFQQEALKVSDSSGTDMEDCLYANCNYMANVMEMVKILARDIKMQVDTGSDRTIISSNIWRTLGSPTLKKYRGGSEAYDGHKMKILGELEETCKWNNKLAVAQMLVVKSPKAFGLLGRDMLDLNVHHAEQQDSESPSVGWDYLPPIKQIKASIVLKPDAQDMFCASRPVPLPLVDKVNAEIACLQRMGVISPCTMGAANASPVVWIKRKDGSLRLCADFEVQRQ